MENMPRYENTDDSHQQQELNPWEKMAQEELMANGPNHEATEKKFYETNVEFSGDDFSNFRNELFNATPDEAKRIIESRITLLEKVADKVKKFLRRIWLSIYIVGTLEGILLLASRV